MAQDSQHRAGLALIHGGAHANEESERRRDLEILMGGQMWEADARACITMAPPASWHAPSQRPPLSPDRVLADIFDCSDPQCDGPALLTAMKERRAFTNLRLRTLDEPLAWVLLSGRPIRDKAGDFVGWRGVVAQRPTFSDTPIAHGPSYKILGLMSEALLRRAQDLLMSTIGALDTIAEDAHDPQIDLARSAAIACLDLQTSFVGFCRAHLMDDELCLVAPLLHRATRNATADVGRPFGAVAVLHHDDLLACTDSVSLYSNIYDFVLQALARGGAANARIIISAQRGLVAKEEGRSELILEADVQDAHNSPVTLRRALEVLCFSPVDLISKMQEAG